jgi:hypothetical protein
MTAGFVGRYVGSDPGETALISVSCTGFTDSAAASLAFRWLPEDIIRAFA